MGLYADGLRAATVSQKLKLGRHTTCDRHLLLKTNAAAKSFCPARKASGHEQDQRPVKKMRLGRIAVVGEEDKALAQQLAALLQDEAPRRAPRRAPRLYPRRVRYTRRVARRALAETRTTPQTTAAYHGLRSQRHQFGCLKKWIGKRRPRTISHAGGFGLVACKHRQPRDKQPSSTTPRRPTSAPSSHGHSCP